MKSRNRILAACAIGIVWAVSGVLAWVQLSTATADQVTVTWAAAPTCTGTTVNTKRPTPVIEAVEGMRCVVPVVAHNGSDRTVHLDNAYAAYLGTDSGAVVRAAPTGLLDGATHFGLDARYRLDRDLAPGGDYDFDVVVVFRPSGCNDSGTFTAYRWPKLELTALGRTHHIAADSDFRFHRDGATPGCSHL